MLMLGTWPLNRRDIWWRFKTQLQAMSDDDPDLAPKEWAQSENPTDVALSPPPPPKFPRVLPAKIECTDAERAQVQAWDLNSVQAIHNWCQERLAAACQATPEGSLPEGG